VSNVSGHSLRARLRAVPQPPTQTSWIDVGVAAERDFTVGATENFLVTATVPPTAPPGTYLFRTDAIGEQNPDDDFAQGPTIALTVPAAEKPKRRFPWWILIVVAVIVLALVLYVVISRSGNKKTPTQTQTQTQTQTSSPSPTTQVAVPQLVGVDLATAEQDLTSRGLGFIIEVQQVLPSQCPPPVLEQLPREFTQVTTGSQVILIVNRPQFQICNIVPANAKQIQPQQPHD